VDYEVVVSKGFTDLKQTAYAQSEPTSDYRVSPADKSNMAKYLFGGFKRGLYPVEKFHSEAERLLAVILDREADKCFKPAKGQFQIFYKSGADQSEYQPDFVAETKDAIYMLEPKAKNQLEDADVLAKKESAVKWCVLATEHHRQNGGKPWKYALIPHDAIAENMTLAGLVGRFEVASL
jgi:type III restriction enzyme